MVLNPLDFFDLRLLLHIACMCSAAFIIFPVGIVLARKHSPHHKSVQICGIIVVALGILTAFVVHNDEHVTHHEAMEPRFDSFTAVDNHTVLPTTATTTSNSMHQATIFVIQNTSTTTTNAPAPVPAAFFPTQHPDHFAHEKRHQHDLSLSSTDPEEFTHAAFHSTFGLFLFVLLLIQGAMGCMSDTRGIRSKLIPSLLQTHRQLGSVIVAVLFLVQAITGIDAVFQLTHPSFSGVDQFVGHFGPGIGIFLLAIAYYKLYERQATKLLTNTSYYAYNGESGIFLLLGIASLVYSVESEWPYDMTHSQFHLAMIIIIIVMQSVTLFIVYRHSKLTKPVPLFIHNGSTIAIMAFILGILFIVHEQPTEYGTDLHRMFGVLILLIGVLRLACAFRTVSFLLFISGVVFISSQRGFQVLQYMFYSHVTASEIAVVDILFGAAMYVYMVLWRHYASKKKAIVVPDVASLTLDVDATT